MTYIYIYDIVVGRSSRVELCGICILAYRIKNLFLVEFLLPVFGLGASCHYPLALSPTHPFFIVNTADSCHSESVLPARLPELQAALRDWTDQLNSVVSLVTRVPFPISWRV